MAVSFQILMNPEDCVGSVYNRKVAMHCLWTMHRARFKPSSIINVGVGSAPELKIWRWILPTVPILAIDPREKYSRRRRGYRGFRYVQAIAGETDGESVFCQACRSIQCKCQATHEAAGRWKKFKTATIDNLVSEFGLKPPHFVWMDIDGGEVSALSGATETLKNTGWLCVELTNWVPRHVRDILKLLHRRGFVLKVRFSKDGLFRNGRFFKR